MLPKFHKPVIDFRYIAAGKLCDKTLNYMDNYKFKFKNTSGYWIAKNKDNCLSALNYLNNTACANSIAYFDFKKLYTNLPHAKVIIKISDLITRCSNEKKVDYISINNSYRASWTNKCNGSWHLKCSDIIELFSFLMNNIYVKFQGRVNKHWDTHGL